MTFSLLLQKAKPESGITGRGEGKGQEMEEEVKQQLWGLRALNGLHSGLLWAVLGLSLPADRSGSPSRFDNSLNP